MKRSAAMALLGINLIIAIGCGGDDDEEELPGDTPCEKWQSLSLRAGCDYPQGCDIPAACSDAAIGWMECTAKDLAQCTCEMDLQLNCEGSYKGTEGPAKCGSQFSSYNACVMAND